jgi:uncharacterized membrane protein HdeD (DUF308 family)
MFKLLGLFVLYGGVVNMAESTSERGSWRFMLGIGMIAIGIWIVTLPEAGFSPTGQAWG